MNIQVIFLTIIVVSLTVTMTTVYGDCRQSYITLCDELNDVVKAKDAESWTELMIGSATDDAKMSPAHLMKFPWTKLPKLRSMIILKKINGLQSTYAYECTYRNDIQLQYLSFYGNNFAIIEEYHFPVMGVKKMSLVNNNIEEVKGGAFTYHKVEIFDLSDNKLEAIEKEALPSTNSTKVIVLKNNRISHIEPGSFGAGLRNLYLDKNKLRNLQDGVIEGLQNLQELSLSDNKFKTMINNVGELKSLRILDLSFNEISTIPSDIFADLVELQVLDLTHNKLTEISYLVPLLSRSGAKVEISLALNKIESGNDFKNLTLGKNVLYLHGNPWDCRDWEVTKKIVEKNQEKCDLKFINSGIIPYCVDYLSLNYPFVSQREIDQDKLQNIIQKKRHDFDCDLRPSRYYLLYPMLSGCVA